MRKFLFVFFVYSSLIVVARQEYKIERHTTDNGLPANYVLDICQDHKGFLWFGLRGACCRFDGFRYQTFPVLTPEGDVPIQTSIIKVICDKNNRLWIGEIGQFGLLQFDYKKEVFINFTDSLHLPHEMIKINVNSMICDRNGELWIGAGNYGIIRFNPETGESEHIIHRPGKTNTIPPGTCTEIFDDGDKHIWFGIDGQVCKFNSITKKINLFKLQGSRSVKCLMRDGNNTLLLAQGLDGILRFNESSGNFIKVYFPDEKKIFKDSEIRCIHSGSKKNLWIGTNKGLFLYNDTTNSLQGFYTDEAIDESINSNSIRVIFEDRTGNIWIGTSEGVAKMKPQVFKTYRYSAQHNSISHNKVHCFFEKDKNEILIATTKGIDLFQRNIEKFNPWAGLSNSLKKQLSAPPLVIYPNFNTGLWIGTYYGGMNYIDFKSNEILTLRYNPLDPESLSSDAVFSLIYDNNDLLWVGTWDGGISVFNSKTGGFNRFLAQKEDSTSLLSNYIQYLYKDSDGKIWIAMVGGVAVVDNVNDIRFRHIIDNSTYELNQEIIAYHILQSKNRRTIWLATNIGLIRHNTNDDTLIRYTQKNGLPSSLVYGILEDSQHNIWISTANGLAMFKPNYDSKDTVLKLKIYKKTDGLQENEFLPSSCKKLSDGSLLWGGIKGFTMFHPKNIAQDTTPPLISFTTLKVENKTVKIGEEINGQIILDNSLEQKKQIVLNYKNNKFSISFIALHFNQASRNKYAYKLENFDAKWIYTNASNREADYMNLKGGDYIFRVKASNSDGLWTKSEKSLKITILPPWWKSYWFSSIWIFLMIASIFLLVKIRTYKLNKQKEKLEEIVAQRTNELILANSELEEKKEELMQQMQQMKAMNNKNEQMAKKLHETDQSKLRFFANISHEFRTPLSLIIAPLDKLQNMKQPIDWNMINLSRYHQLMLKNAQRLMRLINQIIDFRKIDSGQKKINRTNNNITEFIDDVVNTFSVLAVRKNQQLSFNIDHSSLIKEENSTEKSNQTSDEKKENNKLSNEEDQVINDKRNLSNDKWSMIKDFWFDPDVMEKILYNLISNALKYTPEGGEISIQIRVKSEELKDRDKKNSKSETDYQQIGTSTNQHSQNSSLITHHSSLEIIISDNGIGIQPENIEKIFDRFYRIESENDFKAEGTGIGLAYTKELVELHNGTITVDSVPNNGANFILHFPLYIKLNKNEYPDNKDANMPVKLEYIHSMIREESTDVTTFPEKATQDIKEGFGKIPESGAGQKSEPTILIVEDNEDLRQFIRTELKNLYIVIEAQNGAIGLEKAIAKLPDLIISDIMMPEMDGIELCRKLKKHEATCHIPVILLTAKANESDTITGFETGADDYITKPFKLLILKARIDNLLKIRKQLQAKFALAPLDISHKISTTTSIDANFLKRATKIVKENISNSDFDNDTFIKLMGMSRTMIYTKIKALTDLSLGEFTRTIRLKYAAKLLLEGSKNISEVAYLTGFKYRQNFTNYFIDAYGYSPSEYIRKNKNT